MRHIALYAAAILLSVLCSCSKTFEDRGECPCVLTLDCSAVPSSVKSMDVWILDGSGRSSYMKKIYTSDFSRPISVEIDRIETADICVWGNIKNSEIHGTGKDTYFIKRKSVDADSLYKQVERIDSRCDDLSHRIILTKEFSTITLLFSQSMSFNGNVELTYHQPVCGYYAEGGSVEGDADITLFPSTLPNGQSKASFNMLRNDLKNSSELEVIVSIEDNERKHFTIPIWKYLEEAGFDMDKENLDDITFSLDYSFNVISVTINDWTECPPYKIEF